MVASHESDCISCLVSQITKAQSWMSMSTEVRKPLNSNRRLLWAMKAFVLRSQAEIAQTLENKLFIHKGILSHANRKLSREERKGLRQSNSIKLPNESSVPEILRSLGQPESSLGDCEVIYVNLKLLLSQLARSSPMSCLERRKYIRIKCCPQAGCSYLDTWGLIHENHHKVFAPLARRIMEK